MEASAITQAADPTLIAALRRALREAGEARFGREADSAGGRTPGFAAAWAQVRGRVPAERVDVSWRAAGTPQGG
jgi:hypothetical protein